MDHGLDEKEPVTPSTIYEQPVESLDLNEEEKGQHGKRPSSLTQSDRRSSDHTTIAENLEDVDQGGATLQRTNTSTRSAVKVPRSARRGLFGRCALVAEVTQPKDSDNKIKWFITFIVAFAGAAAPVGSAVIFPSLDQVARELHSTATVTNLSVALYMLSMAIFPLWWSAFSEASGRRTVYLASFAFFVVFAALGAISNSIGMLIAMRMLSGGAAASVQAVGAGTIADVWEPRERGRAMGIFYLGPLCGPLFAPIIGGAVGQKWDWRATLWFLVIYGGVTWILVFFALPETLAVRKDIVQEAAAEATASNELGDRPSLSRTSTRERVQTTSKKWAKMARLILINPLKIILYLRFPPVLLTVYYASVTFGSLYVLNVSLQDTYEKPPYNFSTILVGLTYLPGSLGYVCASVFGGRWMDSIMRREAIKANRYDENGKLEYRPEDRMRENAWLGSMMYPAALLWYGWAAQKGAYWIVPLIANFFYGVGSMLIFAMATTMLTEFMPRKSSSGVAVNNFMRNIFSCVGGIVGAPLISAIGNGWLFTILGLWALSSSVVIWAMRRFGPRWRETMDREMP